MIMRMITAMVTVITMITAIITTTMTTARRTVTLCRAIGPENVRHWPRHHGGSSHPRFSSAGSKCRLLAAAGFKMGADRRADRAGVLAVAGAAGVSALAEFSHP